MRLFPVCWRRWRISSTLALSFSTRINRDRFPVWIFWRHSCLWAPDIRSNAKSKARSRIFTSFGSRRGSSPCVICFWMSDKRTSSQFKIFSCCVTRNNSPGASCTSLISRAAEDYDLISSSTSAAIDATLKTTSIVYIRAQVLNYTNFLASNLVGRDIYSTNVILWWNRKDWYSMGNSADRKWSLSCC